ncbi:hypothetical protein ABE29_10345 [Cytobacillus firmus]|nr:hypothetical protein [Cytobacillus firmus]MBG9543173.1 hypothetical protein [Cytobacillus firmus]MBG9552476.1 hypothetical protein [Cytobacillus firmus]MBG9558863.1 hypothetical protein [Cytobacillus firmus]MBG9575445.1 hypothetical protein [Cytobacillus firmus]MEC1892941.1 hypothetical protein [Cytobacillus firmus]
MNYPEIIGPFHWQYSILIFSKILMIHKAIRQTTTVTNVLLPDPVSLTAFVYITGTTMLLQQN